MCNILHSVPKNNRYAHAFNFFSNFNKNLEAFEIIYSTSKDSQNSSFSTIDTIYNNVLIVEGTSTDESDVNIEVLFMADQNTEHQCIICGKCYYEMDLHAEWRFSLELESISKAKKKIVLSKIHITNPKFSGMNRIQINKFGETLMSTFIGYPEEINIPYTDIPIVCRFNRDREWTASYDLNCSLYHVYKYFRDFASVSDYTIFKNNTLILNERKIEEKDHKEETMEKFNYPNLNMHYLNAIEL